MRCTVFYREMEPSNVNSFTCRAIYPVGNRNSVPTSQYLRPCLPRHRGRHPPMEKQNARRIPTEKRPSRNGLALQLGRRNEEKVCRKMSWIDRAMEVEASIARPGPSRRRESKPCRRWPP